MAATVASMIVAEAAPRPIWPREGHRVHEGARHVGGVAWAAGGQRHHQVEALDGKVREHHQRRENTGRRLGMMMRQ